MPDEPVVVPVSEHCSAFIQMPGGWFLNNAGWVTGDERTLLVDTCATEARSRHLLRAAERADRSGAPLAAALTHAHGDHAHGASLVTRAGGEVVSTSAAAADITTGPHTYPAVFSFTGWGDISPPPRTTRITQTTELDLGGTTVQLVPAPRKAHTDGDLVVWIPDDNVLFAGDLVFSGVTPLALSGSVRGWLDCLDWIEGFGATCLVPGHGPVSTAPAEPINAVRGYLEWLIEVVIGSEEPDYDALENQARADFNGWLDAERHAVNLRIARAEALGEQCSFETALAAMRRAAGGKIELDLQL